MAEYIKRSDAIETLTQMCWHDEDGYPVEDADEKRQYAEDWVNAIPSADVAEVRHGEWLWDGYVYDEPYVCNCCGSRMDYESNFCPHCGATMEEWMVSDVRVGSTNNDC